MQHVNYNNSAQITQSQCSLALKLNQQDQINLNQTFLSHTGNLTVEGLSWDTSPVAPT